MTKDTDDFAFLLGKRGSLTVNGVDVRGEIDDVVDVIDGRDPVVRLTLDEELPNGQEEFVTPLAYLTRETDE